jgi:hypothetical protein
VGINLRAASASKYVKGAAGTRRRECRSSFYQMKIKDGDDNIDENAPSYIDRARQCAVVEVK